MFQFTSRPGSSGSPHCDGLYVEEQNLGTINGKPVFVNNDKQMILAGLPHRVWVITSKQYYNEIFEKQGNFGGFYSGGSDQPHLGSWEKFFVKEIPSYLVFLVPGRENVPDCTGSYSCDPTKGQINGNYVFMNKDREMFMAAQANNTWVITHNSYFNEVKSKQGTVGGFDFGGGDDPDHKKWTNHDVKRMPSKYKNAEKFSDKEMWKKFENMSVTFKACANSGAVRTEYDFESIRIRCIDLNCGGFSLRKPHYNQFGEEDDPPVCFFYRKTQSELSSAMQYNNKFDFYLACANFCPDCSFKPGRDPAPSCHIRWNTKNMVHGFACQLVVPEATNYTYYCACGFSGGYCGIQQHNEQRQQMLFSVWDHPTANARVKSESSCDGVVTRPFGGEGKGMQACVVCGSCDRDDNSIIAKWSPNVPYTFVVRAYPVSNGTEYRCIVHKPESGWQELARHCRPEPVGSERGKLSGLYSFIEDFSGNSIVRSATYAAWVQESPGAAWLPVTHVTGTSTADDDVPNKCVRKITNDSGFQCIEMISGGDCLPDYSLYHGSINPIPPPNILTQI